MKRFLQAVVVAAFFTLLAVPTALAQGGGPPFLRIPLDAQFAALGDTYTAYSIGSAAMVGNPAGLAVGRSEASLTFQRWIASTGIYNGSARFGLGRQSGVGLSVIMFDATGDDHTNAPSADPAEGVQYVALGAGAAHQIGTVRVGLAATYLAERVFDDNASGISIDGGAQAVLINGDVLLGLSIQNIGSMSSRGSVSTDLPLMVRLGGAVYPVHVYSGSDSESTFRLFLAPEFVIYPDDDIYRLHLGMGVEVSDLLSLRVGYLSNNDLRTFTAGAGVIYGTLEIDYAFLPLAEGFDGPSHMLTLTYGW